jgi:hypothetical protein
LDNILDDYLGNPEMSLLEVIADLEDKRPIVGVVKEDWQRRCMAEGARWVGEAVVGWWEEWFGEEEGSDDNNWEDEDGNENIEEVALRAVNNVGERDEIRQRGDSMMVDDEVEQPGAEREKTGHGLGSAGLGDREISQEEVGEAAVEDGEPGDLAVSQGSILEHITSPPDKVDNSNDMVSDGAGTSEVRDGSQSDGEERRQDAKEARVVICILRLLGRWVELQLEHAAKTGQADR